MMSQLLQNIILSLCFYLLGFGSQVWYDRRFRKRGKLTLINPVEIQLFNKDVNNLDSIKILYNDEPTNEQIILYQGMIANTGNVDLQMLNMQQSITIKTPSQISWLEFVILEHPNRVHIDSRITNEHVSIYFDQLNVKEGFKYKAVLRADINFNFESLTKLLVFDHRILQAEKKINSAFYEGVDDVDVKIIPFWWVLPALASFFWCCVNIWSGLFHYKPHFNSSFPHPPGSTPEVLSYETRLHGVFIDSIIGTAVFFLIFYITLYRRTKKNLKIRDINTNQ